MGFEQFHAKDFSRYPDVEPSLSVHGRRGQLWLNLATMRLKIGEAEHVTLWYDQEQNRCGLRVERTRVPGSRRLTKRQGAGIVSCRAFCRMLGITESASYRRALIYDAECDMYVFGGPDQ